VGGDGNLLLNVGPMPDGRIEPRQVEVLKQVGAWMDRNSESIYGTRGGPWKPTKAIASTRKGNAIYLHLLKVKHGQIELPTLAAEIKSAALLNGSKVEIVKKDGKLLIKFDPHATDALDTVVKLTVDRPVMDIPPLEITEGIHQ